MGVADKNVSNEFALKPGIIGVIRSSSKSANGEENKNH